MVDSVSIYNPKSGSATSQNYEAIDLKTAKSIVASALEFHRLVVDVIANKLITSTEEIKVNGVIRILPLVGGG